MERLRRRHLLAATVVAADVFGAAKAKALVGIDPNHFFTSFKGWALKRGGEHAIL
jgi:hypothetical protein